MCAALAVDAVSCYVLAGAVGMRNDLFPRWLATRLWLTTGHDLYSPATDDAIRAAMGTPPLGGDTFVFGFVYPAYVALLLAPLAVLPFRAAATFWLLTIQLGAVGGALLAWRAYERERGLPTASPLPALVTAALLPAAVLNLIFLQLSALVFGALAGCWWLLAQRSETRAAAALLVTAVKPQLALLPAVALLIRATREARWRFVAPAIGGALALTAVSLVLFPAWIERFSASAQAYAGVARPTSAATLLTGGVWWGAVVGTFVTALVSVAWLRSARLTGESLGAAALLAVWLVPPLYEWNNVVLLLVLVPALRVLSVPARWIAALGCVVAALLTFGLMTLRPSESRLIWPAIALAVYLAASRRGSHKLTSSAPAPSVAVRT